ncbi:MAG: hypothetical protein H6Q15_1648 [Bacteroidetes bacterium]|nr:hypothetical protein [Bacteroidota bacterium]
MKLSPTNIFHKDNLIYLLLLIVYIIALYPLSYVGLTTCDDLSYYLMSGNWNSILDVVNYVGEQGRFGFFITIWFNFIPYLIDNNLWHSLCLIIPIAISFLLFIKIIKRVFNDNSLTLLVSILLATNMQIMGKTHLTSTHPIYFCFAFCLILIAILLALDSYKVDRKHLRIISSVLIFFASCFYEIFLAYFLIMLLIVLWKNNIFKGVSKIKLNNSLKEFYPYLISFLFFIAIYFTFRYYFPSSYEGSQFNRNFRLIDFINSANLLGTYSIPLQSYFNYSDLLIRYSPYTDSAFYPYRIELTVAIIGIISSLMTYYLLLKHKPKKSIIYIFGLIIGVILFYLPIIISPLSNMHYQSGLDTHIPSFFSHFGATIFIACLILLIYNLFSKNKSIAITLRIIFSLLVLIVTILTQSTNKAIAYDLKASNTRFEIVRDFFSHDLISPYHHMTGFCFEDVHKSISTLENNATRYKFRWTYYVARTTDKNINTFESYDDLCRRFKGTDSIVYVGYFKQATKSEDAILYFAKLKGKDLPLEQIDVVTNEIIVGYLSPYKSFNVSIASGSNEAYANELLMNSQGSYHSINMPSASFPSNQKISYFKIKGDSLIASSLTISNILSRERGEYYKTNLKARQKRIEELRLAIKKSDTWFSSIKQKAKANNRTIEEQVDSEINYIIACEKQDIHK